MKWYSAKELAGMEGLPKTVRGINKKAKSENWESRPRQGRGGGKEYPVDCLPSETIDYLISQSGSIDKKIQEVFLRLTVLERQFAQQMKEIRDLLGGME